ncbi:hypothetical protein HYDPIDRAFT_24984 [Hydnomerulius pinastri MD-312]|nr:hypothetical protein HYDPIDRAFT_24984 [Hydnomerulius pinastri MD-312]
MHSYSAFTLIFVALAASVHSLPVDDIVARNGVGDAFSGAGGQASGGSVDATPGNCTGTTCPWGAVLPVLEILKVDSENGGNGGGATSGAALGSAALGPISGAHATGKAPMGNSYSGVGGQAMGGSTNDSTPAMIELESDNAGTGGDAPSGSSLASAL